MHGYSKARIVVSCPVDMGGCKDFLTTGSDISGPRMELWESDHYRPWDDLVGLLRFPKLSASIRTSDRTVYGCVAGSDGTYRSRKSGNGAAAVSA